MKIEQGREGKRNVAKAGAFAAAAVLGFVLAGSVAAKLPAPTEEQKAKAAELKAKADETAKKEAEALAKSQDRTVEHVKRTRAVKR